MVELLEVEINDVIKERRRVKGERKGAGGRGGEGGGEGEGVMEEGKLGGGVGMGLGTGGTKSLIMIEKAIAKAKEILIRKYRSELSDEEIRELSADRIQGDIEKLMSSDGFQLMVAEKVIDETEGLITTDRLQFPTAQGENLDLPIRSERKKSIEDCDFFNTISEMRTLQPSWGQNLGTANGKPANR